MAKDGRRLRVNHIQESLKSQKEKRESWELKCYFKKKWRRPFQTCEGNENRHTRNQKDNKLP